MTTPLNRSNLKKTAGPGSLLGDNRLRRKPWISASRILTVFNFGFRRLAGCQGRLALLYGPPLGHVAEWLRSGLQSRERRFDSGRGLHFPFYPQDSAVFPPSGGPRP